MRLFFIIFTCFSSIIASAQSLNFTICDAVSRLPIDYATVVDSATQTGTLSNKDGKIAFVLNKADGGIIKISHINYAPQSLAISALQKTDTIFLQRLPDILEEAVVIHFDLKQKIQELLESYDDFYIDYPTLREGTYKETFKVNNKITRLILSDIDWWTKSEQYKFGYKNFANFCAIELKNTKTLLNKPVLPTLKGKGTLLTHDLINRMYLYWVLTVYSKLMDALTITAYARSVDWIKVKFETEFQPVQKNSIDSIQLNGTVVFDGQTKAIHFLEMEAKFRNVFLEGKGMVDTTEQFKSISDKAVLRMSFDKGSDAQKLSLRYMEFLLSGTAQVNNGEVFKVSGENVLYITKTKKERSFKGKSIDFAKPIYENVSSNTANQNTVPLTREEQEAIRKNELIK